MNSSSLDGFDHNVSTSRNWVGLLPTICCLQETVILGKKNPNIAKDPSGRKSSKEIKLLLTILLIE